MRHVQAPNVQAVLNYVRTHRPDCIDQFEAIAEGPRNERQDALLMLLATGFAAGRQYQIDHPGLGVHSYHTDPPVLQQKPRRSL